MNFYMMIVWAAIGSWIGGWNGFFIAIGLYIFVCLIAAELTEQAKIMENRTTGSDYTAEQLRSFLRG